MVLSVDSAGSLRFLTLLLVDNFYELRVFLLFTILFSDLIFLQLLFEGVCLFPLFKDLLHSILVRLLIRFLLSQILDF